MSEATAVQTPIPVEESEPLATQRFADQLIAVNQKEGMPGITRFLLERIAAKPEARLWDVVDELWEKLTKGSLECMMYGYGDWREEYLKLLSVFTAAARTVEDMCLRAENDALDEEYLS